MNKVIHKGRASFEGMKIKTESTLLTYMLSFYILSLKIPAQHFLILLISVPILLSFLFLPFYLYGSNGFHFHSQSDTNSFTLSNSNLVQENFLDIFLFSFSLSTTLGTSSVQPISIYLNLISNLHTLCSQLVFVFLSGATFQRLSQPFSPIKWSKHLLLSDSHISSHTISQKWKEEKEEASNQKRRMLKTRFIVQGKFISNLIDIKFNMTMRRTMFFENDTSASTSASSSAVPLTLVKPEMPFLKYGFLVRHVIDESSPLFNLDLETLKKDDAVFHVSISGYEESSMQKVYSDHFYFANDDDVVLNMEYEDIIQVYSNGERMRVDNRMLNRLKPLQLKKECF